MKFNLDHAKAGAPVELSDGTEATIIKFDGRQPGYPLIVLVGEGDVPYSAKVNGEVWGINSVLTMRPLGHCEGKPVFMGDKLVNAAGEYTVTLGLTQVHFGMSEWPNQYPVTQLTSEQIGDLEENPVTIKGDNYGSTRNMINAAIKHGIDNGYLMDPTKRQVVDPMFETIGKIVFPADRDFNYAQLLQEIKALVEYKAKNSDADVAAKRDMAVAKYFYTHGGYPSLLHNHLRPMPPDAFFNEELKKVRP